MEAVRGPLPMLCVWTRTFGGPARFTPWWKRWDEMTSAVFSTRPTVCKGCRRSSRRSRRPSASSIRVTQNWIRRRRLIASFRGEKTVLCSCKCLALGSRPTSQQRYAGWTICPLATDAMSREWSLHGANRRTEAALPRGLVWKTSCCAWKRRSICTPTPRRRGGRHWQLLPANTARGCWPKWRMLGQRKDPVRRWMQSKRLQPAQHATRWRGPALPSGLRRMPPPQKTGC